MRARGFRPWSFTACSLAMSSAADASEIWLDTAAVSRPPSTSVGSERIFSQLGSRGPSSNVHSPSGTISLLEAALGARPQRALVRLDRERLHVVAGDVPLLGDHLGAAELRDLLVAVARLPARRPGERRLVNPNGSPASIADDDRDLAHVLHAAGDDEVAACPTSRACAAKCTACCDEPHCRSTVVPGTSSGKPATSQQVRAMSPACGPMRVDAAEHDVVDRGRVDAGALDERLDRVGAEVGGVDLRQAAAAPPDRACGPRRRCRPRPWRCPFCVVDCCV